MPIEIPNHEWHYDSRVVKVLQFAPSGPAGVLSAVVINVNAAPYARPFVVMLNDLTLHKIPDSDDTH